MERSRDKHLQALKGPGRKRKPLVNSDSLCIAFDTDRKGMG